MWKPFWCSTLQNTWHSFKESQRTYQNNPKEHYFNVSRNMAVTTVQSSLFTPTLLYDYDVLVGAIRKKDQFLLISNWTLPSWNTCEAHWTAVVSCGLCSASSWTRGIFFKVLAYHSSGHAVVLEGRLREMGHKQGFHWKKGAAGAVTHSALTHAVLTINRHIVQSFFHI